MIDLDGYPADTRIIVRRERPHPGAQLSLFDQDEGLRHQVFLTDTPYPGGGSAQFLEVRHRGHATAEDHIRCGKTTGFGRFPSRDSNVNTVWLELSLTAIDLLAWMRVLLLDGELAAAEPKKLRYRLLHVAALLTRGGRRLRLRISATWPWKHELTTAFHRLAALPRPSAAGKSLPAHNPKDPYRARVLQPGPQRPARRRTTSLTTPTTAPRGHPGSQAALNSWVGATAPLHPLRVVHRPAADAELPHLGGERNAGVDSAQPVMSSSRPPTSST